MAKPTSMFKPFKKKLYHINEHGDEENGPHKKLKGNIKEMFGNCTGIYGDGTGVLGDVTGLMGNLDACEITEDERKYGIAAHKLVLRLYKTTLNQKSYL